MGLIEVLHNPNTVWPAARLLRDAISLSILNLIYLFSGWQIFRFNFATGHRVHIHLGLTKTLRM